VSALTDPLKEESRVVIHAKPTWWTKKGTLQLQGAAVQVVGLGDLLRRVEELKQRLAGEGLFSREHKKPLPFLPHTVGLICATQGDAEHDVVTNARQRWPAVAFAIRRVTVQGPRAVPEVTAALAELDADPTVDVIVIARGG